MRTYTPDFGRAALFPLSYRGIRALYQGRLPFVNTWSDMKQLDVTTSLDLLGLALVSAGVAVGLWPFIAGFALVPAGLSVILASWLAARQRG